MNKQEALAYVHNLLAQDCPREQIVSALAGQLGAPPDLIEKFVALAEKDFRQAKASIPPPGVLPPPAVVLPPWLRETDSSLPAPAAPVPAITTIPQAEAFAAAELAKGKPRTEIIQELAQQTGEPIEMATRFLDSLDPQRRPTAQRASTVAVPAAASHASRPRRLTLEENPELVKFTLSELGKHRKRSDVASAVCERTGVEWSEVQRFVGTVETQYRGKVQARKNVFIIPLAIGSCLIGLVVTLVSAWTAIFPFLIFLPNSNAPDTNVIFDARVILYSVLGFFSGIGMIGGGIIGIYRGVRAQID